MSTLSYKSKFANEENRTQNWYLIDAEGKILGRLASEIANIIRGKKKPDFTPHFNSGDKVVVINAEKVRLTGNKMTDKQYKRFSGYPGGLKTFSPKEELSRNPEYLIQHAVKGMLPKNKLQAVYMKNLFIYIGQEHPHQAQNPVQLEIQ